MERRKYLITLAGVGGMALAGCSGEEGEVDGGGGGDGDGVVVHNHELTSDAIGDAVVEGEATNELGSEETINMEATFYNDEGTIIDDGITDRNADIPDGQRFQFEIISTVDFQDVGDYDLEWSTGF